MNERLNNLPTLSKTITIGKKNNQNEKNNLYASDDNRNITTTANQEMNMLNKINQSNQSNQSNNNLPNFNDINHDCNNVVFNEYPMFSN